MDSRGAIYQSALENAASWSSLEFIGTQIEPDAGVYLAKLNNYLAAFKQYNTEFFYDAGNSSGSILSPVQNAAFKVAAPPKIRSRKWPGLLYGWGRLRTGSGAESSA